MKPQYKVIEVPKLEERRQGPFSMVVVITPEGNYCYKGRIFDIDKVIKNKFHSYLRINTMFSHNEHWSFVQMEVKGNRVSVSKSIKVNNQFFDFNKTNKFHFYTGNDLYRNLPPKLSLRRIPNKWIPEYDKLID